jgi:hypothetical protein
MNLMKDILRSVFFPCVIFFASALIWLPLFSTSYSFTAKKEDMEIDIDDYSEVCAWAEAAGAVDDKINDKLAEEKMDFEMALEGYWVRKWTKHEFYGATRLTKRPAIEHIIEVRRNPKRHKNDPAVENLAEPKNYFYFKETIRNWNPRCVISSQTIVIRSSDPETGITKRYWLGEEDFNEVAQRKLRRSIEQNCHPNGVVEQLFSMTEHLDPETQKRVGTYDELMILYNENKLPNVEQPQDPLEWGGEIPTGEKLSWVKKEEESWQLS